MIWAALFALVFVALGGAIGLSRAKVTWFAIIRVIGLGAGCFAVFAQLLPEAAHEAGYWALIPFAITLLGSVLLELTVRTKARAVPTLSIDLGFLALLVHQALEGVALGALAATITPLSLAILMMVSLTLHTVPIVAAFTFAIRELSGRLAALSRVVLLAAVGALGAVLSSNTDPHSLHGFGGLVHAGVAGLLLHAVTHVADAREAGPSRGVTVGAFLLGLVLAAPSLWAIDADHLLTVESVIVVLSSALFAAVVLFFTHRGHAGAHSH